MAATPYRAAPGASRGGGRVDLRAAAGRGSYETESSVDDVLSDLEGLGPHSNSNAWGAWVAGWATAIATVVPLGIAVGFLVAEEVELTVGFGATVLPILIAGLVVRSRFTRGRLSVERATACARLLYGLALAPDQPVRIRAQLAPQRRKSGRSGDLTFYEDDWLELGVTMVDGAALVLTRSEHETVTRKEKVRQQMEGGRLRVKREVSFSTRKSVLVGLQLWLTQERWARAERLRAPTGPKISYARLVDGRLSVSGSMSGHASVYPSLAGLLQGVYRVIDPATQPLVAGRSRQARPPWEAAQPSWRALFGRHRRAD